MSGSEQEGDALPEVNVFFDLSLDLLCIAGLDGYFKRLNPAWTEVLGYSIEELTSRPFNDFVHPDDRDKTAAEVQDLGNGSLTYTFENRYRCKDGSYRWLMWNSRPQVETGLIYAVAHDITEQKAAGESIAKLAAIVQSTDDAIVAWSSDGRITSWNPGAERLYGYLADEMTGLPMRTAMLPLMPDDRPHEVGDLIDALERGEAVSNFESVRVNRNGELFDVSLTMLLLWDRGANVGGSVIVRDETQRKMAQRERDAHNAMLQAVIANSESAIYVKDLDGRYLLANPRFERAFGVTEAEVLGKDDTYLDAKLAPTWRANDVRAQTGEYHIEEWSDGPDGRAYYESVKLPLFDGNGTLYATCGISLDVTERRRATAEREAASVAAQEAAQAAVDAANERARFLATMSHEIRTPINAVIGMTGLLLDTDLDVEQRQFVEIVRTSGDALLAIINDVLDFSRLDAGETELEAEPFDLGACVDDTLSMVAANAAHLDLIATVAEGCPASVSGDAHRLRQVLVNLVGNAVKFTPRGDVVLGVDLAPPLDMVDDGRVRLVFSVRDTGIGIPADRMDRLFRSFTQVDASTNRVYGGSGLGLAISQSIVKAMGGEITVTSEVDAGSAFSFTIDFGRCPEADRADVAPGTDPDLRGKRAFVVDDNDTSRRMLRRYLEGWGMSCTDVANPYDALAVLAQRAAFDVVVLDLNMPDMNGLQLAEQIRAIPAQRNVPLMLLTNLATRPQEATAGLFAAFLPKPVRGRLLRSMLGDVLAPTPPPHTDLPDTAAVGESDPRALRVLLAEDNLVNQKVAVLMVRKLGYSVDLAKNGQEALDAMRHTPYDVVLMDVHMPVMDGLQATQAIRAEIPSQRQPRIIAMTAGTSGEDRTDCRRAGMDDYLGKPVRLPDLANALGAARRVQTDAPPSSVLVAEEELSRETAIRLRLVEVSDPDMPDDRDVFRQMVRSFVDGGTRMLDQLEDALARNAADDIARLAHALRGGAADLGGAELAGLLERIEHSDPDRPLSIALDLQPVRREFVSLSRSLAVVVGELAQDAPQPAG